MSITIKMPICRVCLQSGNAINIYTGDILEKFVYTTLVQVDQNDGLSEIICKKCLTRLHIAYEFKKQAESSDRELRSFITGVNQKFIQVTGKCSKSSKDNNKKGWMKEGQLVLPDDLDEDMEALLNQKDEVTHAYSAYETAENLDDKQMIPREQLVEILGENSLSGRKASIKRSLTYIEESSHGEPEEMEVFLLEEPDTEQACIIEGIESGEDYDENNSEALDETDAQYLEFDLSDELNDSGSKQDRSFVNAMCGTAKDNPTNRCGQCDKAFSTRTNLTRHMITHQGIKPYVCPICKNSFTQKGSLKSHMYIHTGERPYQCAHCDRSFTQSKSLKFHMRRHTGEKPFACEYCGVKFRQKDGLKRHIAAKHPSNEKKKNYKCTLCNKKSFSSKYTLNTHQAKYCENREERDDDDPVSGGNESDGENSKMKHENGEVLGDALMKDEWEDGFACEFCDEIFSSVEEVIQHRSTHPEANDDSHEQ